MIHKISGMMSNNFSKKSDFHTKKKVSNTDSVNISEQAKLTKKKVEATANQKKIEQAKLNLEKYGSGKALANHVAQKIADRIVKSFF